MKFFDRVRELTALERRLGRPASFGLVYGQRRIGKTWLLQRLVAAEPGALFFMADESTSPALLARFHQRVAQLGLGGPTWPTLAQNDWGTSLSVLVQAAAAASRRLVLILDEVQYLLDAEPALPSILQRLWDEYHPTLPLHIILCGSALGTLASLGDVGQPLHGRFDLRLKLTPFGYRDAAQFAAGWSPTERLRMYGVFGGLARHLAEIDPARSLDANAVDAIVDPLGPLHEAPLDLLRTEHLSARADSYAVLSAIAAGENQFGAIAARTGLKGPRAAYVLNELVALDLIERQARHGDKPGAKFARYRCRDPLVRFWFRSIPDHRVALLGAPPAAVWAERIAPELPNHLGPVFEDVVGQAIRDGTLPLAATDLRPYWSRDGQTEIDWVVETCAGLVFVECKWRPNGLAGTSDLSRLRGHVQRARLGHGDPRLCLVTSGGFTPELVEVAAREGVLLYDAAALFPDAG